MNYKDQLKHPKWQKKRLEIMERDAFQCQCCFNRENTLVVHHKYYNNNLKAWEYNNDSLITLCEKCHSIFHEYWNEREYKEIAELLDVNTTDLFILCQYLMRMRSQIGDKYIKYVLKLLLSQTITKDEI